MCVVSYLALHACTKVAVQQGTLDILVQRTGKQTNQKVSFIQNNFFHDAFFLKAIGM